MTLENELHEMGKFVVKVEQDESLKMIREMFPLKELAECVIDKTDKASKEYRAYESYDEDIVKKDVDDPHYVNTAKIVRDVGKVEKYIVCKMIIYFAKEEPTQLMYCGNHFFVLKSLQFLVEILDNRVIIHKYY